MLAGIIDNIDGLIVNIEGTAACFCPEEFFFDSECFASQFCAFLICELALHHTGYPVAGFCKLTHQPEANFFFRIVFCRWKYKFSGATLLT